MERLTAQNFEQELDLQFSHVLFQQGTNDIVHQQACYDFEVVELCDANK